MVRFFKSHFAIPADEVVATVKKAYQELLQAKADVKAEGQKALQWMKENGRKGIVLAGRPYHIDPEINHGIPEMINGYGLAV